MLEVLIVFAIAFLIVVIVLIICYNPHDFRTSSLTISPGGLFELSLPTMTTGKHVVSMKSTLDDVTEEAFIVTYFMPSGINTLMGVNTFAGKIFTVTSNTSETGTYVLSFFNRTNRNITVFYNLEEFDQ
jgi:hypothetical protein